MHVCKQLKRQNKQLQHDSTLADLTTTLLATYIVRGHDVSALVKQHLHAVQLAIHCRLVKRRVAELDDRERRCAEPAWRSV